MMNRHRIVVSAENNPYVAWQAKLFYYSCVSRLHQIPTIIVHETGHKWHRDFFDLVKAGCIVRSAPSYRVTGHGDEYPPRNTAGTLLHAAEMLDGPEEFIVLCDPDMIFVRQPQFPQSLSGEYYSYMDYDQEFVGVAQRNMGKERQVMTPRQKEELRCGVPYVIPVADARRLAEAWLEAVDAFPPRHWVDIMHAFGPAVAHLGLSLTLTHMMDDNCRPDTKLRGDVVHYCYGDDTWDKRHYSTEEKARGVWEPHAVAPKETVLGEILSQLSEARDFYRDPYFDRSGVRR